MSMFGDISPRVGIHAVEQMLAHAEPILVLQKFAQVRAVPKNKGELVRFRRPNPWNAVIVGGGSSANLTNYNAPAMAEGVTPAPTPFTYTDVEVRLNEYGQWVQITDKIQDLHEDPVLQDQTMMAGEAAAETVEMLSYQVMIGGTSVKYAGSANGSRAEVAAKADKNLIRLAVQSLHAQRAKKITNILGPSTNISTRPIEAAYIAFGHTDLAHDLREIAGYTPTAQYGSRQVLCAEEHGALEDVRFILSPLFAPRLGVNGVVGAAVSTTGLKSTGGFIDVYPLVVIGKEAFGVTPLKGFESARIMVLNPGQPRSGDELGQRGSVGWKTWFAAVRLNDNWMYRLEVGATNLS